MSVLPILTLGNPALYKISKAVTQSELKEVPQLVEHLRDTLNACRARHGGGLAIAAPQVGVLKRVVYIQVTAPIVLINPVVEPLGDEIVEVWDNCLSFPDLYVKVRRHRACTLTYMDLWWRETRVSLTREMSVLVQHECDHLEGVLSISRAVDKQSYCLASERHFIGQPTNTVADR